MALDLGTGQARVRDGGYTLPPLAMMRSSATPQQPNAADDAVSTALSKAFQRFQVDARVTGYTRGPTVTRYEVVLGPAVTVEQVTILSRNIAYVLKSPSVRIISPIPGKSAIGVEVPNAARGVVALGDVLRLPAVVNGNHPLLVGLGVDIWERVLLANLAEMPHLLIAGSTGSGKSTAIHGLITSVLTRARPDEVQMVLIDPKQIELSVYEGLPHLITPVTTSAKSTVEVLGWVVGEMEQRYDSLAALGFRRIDDFNSAVRDGKLTASSRTASPLEPYPYLIVVVDELAGIARSEAKQLEAALTRIARRGRIAGVHLVLATDQPRLVRDMPLVRANMPSRLVFRTSSQADSRALLDEPGAETLAGQGDALFLPMSLSMPLRIQGAFVPESEIRQIVAHCRTQPSH